MPLNSSVTVMMMQVSNDSGSSKAHLLINTCRKATLSDKLYTHNCGQKSWVTSVHAPLASCRNMLAPPPNNVEVRC